MAEMLFDISLAVALVVLAAAVLHAPTLYVHAVLFIGFGLLVAITWARLGAPDLALAEAAIGAGLTGVLLLAALSKLPEGGRYRIRWRRMLPATLLLGIFVVLLVDALLPLAHSPAVLPSLVDDSLAQSGVSHPVTAVLLNFRSWDTLLELLVILLALMATRQLGLSSHPMPAPWPLMLAWSQWLAPLALLLGTYLLWRGSSGPGGAFQAGSLWAAGAVTLRLNGLLPALSWRHWALRVAALAGLSFFCLVALATAYWGQGWLAYPAGWEKPLIVAIEVAATLSIATILTLLVAAEQDELTV